MIHLGSRTKSKVLAEGQFDGLLSSEMNDSTSIIPVEVTFQNVSVAVFTHTHTHTHTHTPNEVLSIISGIRRLLIL